MSGNLLLNALRPASRAALAAEELNIDAGTILFRGDSTPQYIYFPHSDAVTSLVRTSAEGLTVETGIVGGEGLSHVDSLLVEPAPAGSDAMVQVPGRFSRVPASKARQCFLADAAFRELALAYTHSLLAQVAQNLVCNRLHGIEARLSKWLLTVRDRVSTDELRLSQEFLAHMLGVHRPAVSLAISGLEADGLVAHARNRITIRERQVLEARACECYAVLRQGLDEFRATCARS